MHKYTFRRIFASSMPRSKPYASTSEAAAVLQVSERRLQQLAETGVLRGERVAGRWLFAWKDVDDTAGLVRRRGRPLHPATIWIVLFVASGLPAPRGAGQRASRARRLLAERGLEGLAPDLRRRGEKRCYAVHPGVMGHLGADPGLVLSGISAAQHHRLGLASSGEIEAYVRASTVEHLQQRFALTEQAEGPVVLRIVEDPAWMLAERFAPLAAVALDLAEASDARSRDIGTRTLRALSASIARYDP